MNLDRRLIKMARSVRAAMGAAVLCAFLAGLALVIQARMLSQAVERVFLRGQGLADVLPLIWLLLVSVAARALLSYFSEFAAAAAAVQVKQRLRDLLTSHLMALGPAFTQGERSGELVNTATQGIEAIDAYFSQYLPQLVLAGMLPLAYLAVIIPLDPLSGTVLLLTGPLIPFFMFLIGTHSHKLTHQQWKTLGRMSAYFLDTLQGLRTLKALGRSAEQGARIDQVSERYRLVTMSVLRITFLSALALELLGTIGTAIVAVQIGLRLLYGGIVFESAFFILLLAPEFYQPLRALGLRFHASMAVAAAARRIFAVLEQPAPAWEAVNVVDTAGQQPSKGMRKDKGGGDARLDWNSSKPFSVTFDRVSFTYPGRSTPALKDVTIHLPAGKTTAIVGTSGAGKSTLANLLLRFLPPDGGVIRVDDQELSTIPLELWRSRIAWVPQRPYLFHGTISDNLRLANPQASEADLRCAAEQAHLTEFVDRLPLGLKTPLGEGGAQVSAGQAQRVALARAFLRDAPLVVLDEPTAHLDVAFERQLQESTRQLCAGRTVLVIAHRLSTVVQAEQIVVMDGGCAAETGSHAELLARGGAYTNLFAAYQGSCGGQL